jgi:hypothetical protein
MLNRFNAWWTTEAPAAILSGEGASENAAQQPLAGLWLDRGILVAVILGAVVGISPNFVDPDLWGHVQYGRDLLRNGLPTTTTYSYVAQGYPWINHEILAEVILALAADWLGPHGMLIAKALLGAAVIGAVMRYARLRHCGTVVVAVMALVTAPNLAYSWSLRPQILSLAAFAALLYLLGYVFEGWEGHWRLRWPLFLWPSNEPIESHNPPDDLGYDPKRLKYLWLVVPLFAAWTNAHGGFLAGLCVFVAYLGLRSIEALSIRGRLAFPLVSRFALMMVVGCASTIINPYGFEFHLWLFDDLKVPRPEIVEWLPTNWFEAGTIPRWLIGGLWLITLVKSPKRHDFTHTVVAGLLLWQTCEHRRHGAFWALALSFWLAPHVELAWQLLQGRRSDAASHGEEMAGALSPANQRRLASGLLVVYGLLGWMLWSRMSQITVERKTYPVSAIQFIADRNFTGKIVCNFNWAQYLLYAFGPGASGGRPDDGGLLVQVDGRCRTSYSQEMLDQHFDFLLGDLPTSLVYKAPGHVCDPAAVLQEGRPDLVLLDREYDRCAQLMKDNSERWVLLYQDSEAQLWGRRNRYDDPQSPDYVTPRDRRISDAMQAGSVCWPALPSQMASGIETVPQVVSLRSEGADQEAPIELHEQVY